jgi:predicted Zn-dependent protease
MAWRVLCGIAALAGATLLAQDATVRVREVTVTLPTYDEGAPDTNPQFDWFYKNPFPNYPYPIRTPINKLRRMTEWRALVLENEYLSCRILPDLGGHLHGCTDKITGREIFYANPAIRRGPESARGAFIATGIESSFPVAHSRVGSSPVDFAVSGQDGAARVVVEDTDRVSGMEWRCDFILRPGSTVLEQRVILHNGSAARRGYQWWTDAAVELDDPHLQFLYPTHWMVPHGEGAMLPWPGVNLSDTAVHKTQLGLFSHGSREPWMAVYKPGSRSGLVHYADPGQVPGKKLWLWGSTDTYVRQNLTENFNSYVEMQAGLFETQMEFGFLLPGEIKSFSHFWIPFRDLGGVSRATRDAVLHLRRTDAGAVVELNATRQLPGAALRVLDGSATLSETKVDLDPKVTFSKTIASPPARVTVELVDAAGAVLLRHVEGETDALPFDGTAKNPQPLAPPDSASSDAQLLERGSYYEQREQFSLASRNYQEGLKRYPDSRNLAKAAGRVLFVLNRYEEAVQRLAPLDARAPDDAEAAYYYGAALAATGASAEARSALSRASRDAAYGAAARLQLALLAARERDFTAAMQFLEAPATQPMAASTGALQVAILRRAGKTGEAKQLLRSLLAQDPARNLLRFEQVLLGEDDGASLWPHLAADRERILNLVDQYFQLGAFDDALKLLERRYPGIRLTQIEPGAVLPQNHPLIAYYRGFCRLQLGQDPTADFQTAAALSTRYVFPNRASSYPVLKAALAKNDKDAVAHALLGDLYFQSLQSGSAIQEWRKALALRPDLPALYRNLGKALLDVENNPAAALPILQGGQRLEPGNREIEEALSRASRGPVRR